MQGIKRLLLLFFIFNLIFSCAFAIEDVIEEPILPDFNVEDDVTPTYKTGIEKIFMPKKIVFESGFVNELEASVLYRGNLSMDFNSFLGYEPYVQTTVKTIFGDRKNEIKFSISPLNEISHLKREFFGLFADVYYKRNLNENHSVFFGNIRTPVGYEGSLGIDETILVNRSQLANTFGNTRSTGIKFKGDFGYIGYDIGGYSSTRALQHFSDGLEFAGWLDYKPFYKQDNLFKTLKLGAGLNTGYRHEGYLVSSFGAKWDYKKLHLTTEYGIANGANGSYGLMTDKAQGFNATVAYDLTDKLQLVGRYDIFDANLDIANNNTSQYTAGINYFIFGNRLRLLLNYVFEDNPSKNKNMLFFLTQIMI